MSRLQTVLKMQLSPLASMYIRTSWLCSPNWMYTGTTQYTMNSARVVVSIVWLASVSCEMSSSALARASCSPVSRIIRQIDPTENDT